jgi:conjugative transposon protein TcpC
MKQLGSSLPSLPKLPRLPGLPRLPRPSGQHRHPLRLIRLRARTPRILLGVLVLVLCVAGVRSIFGPRPIEAAPTSTGTHYDVGAADFAQSFTSAYLTWNSDTDESERAIALKPFLSQGLDSDAGLTPARKTSESVRSTQVAEESRAGGVTNVLVVAQTSAGTQYVSVPIARDERGLLSIVSYPALVGPPASDTSESVPSLELVEDQGLETVVSRALRNYLTGQAANLRADLTSGAVISLPPQPLEVSEVDSANWLVPRRTVAVQVEAKNRQGTEFTLTYQVGVVRRDRWYIDSIQVDPTLKGGM